MISKAYAYTIRIDDLSTYMKVKEYLTHFDAFNHYRSEWIIDLDTYQDYIEIYVDYSSFVKLDPEKLYGASLRRCRALPKNKIKSIFHGHHIIDTVIDEQSESESMSFSDSQPPEPDKEQARINALEAKLDMALGVLQHIIES